MQFIASKDKHLRDMLLTGWKLWDVVCNSDKHACTFQVFPLPHMQTYQNVRVQKHQIWMHLCWNLDAIPMQLLIHLVQNIMGIPVIACNTIGWHNLHKATYRVSNPNYNSFLFHVCVSQADSFSEGFQPTPHLFYLSHYNSHFHNILNQVQGFRLMQHWFEYFIQ
jgi:hypothetical protein